MVDLASWLGYRTVVVDDRAELVEPDAQPNADVRFAGTVAEALDTEPVSIGYAQHEGGERADWDADKLAREVAARKKAAEEKLAAHKKAATERAAKAAAARKKLEAERERGELFTKTLAGLKSTLDPKWVLNPGVLLEER